MADITDALIGQDMSSELRAECSERLYILKTLAEAKTEYYVEKFRTTLLGAGTGSDRSLPISTIQSFTSQIKAYTPDSAKRINNVVRRSIKGFVSNDNVPAVANLISGFVDIMFATSSKAENEVDHYIVILEGQSIVRLDFAGWSRMVTSRHLMGKCDYVSAFVLCRSIVDMERVSWHDFYPVYLMTLQAENPGIAKSEMMKKCYQLYSAFHPN